jgi:hypothetical protein
LRASDCHTQSHYLLRQTGRFDLNQTLIRYARFPPPWTVEELDACFVVRGLRKSFEKGLI